MSKSTGTATAPPAAHRVPRHEADLAGLLVHAEALIFDLDGTLVDSEKYHLKAFAQAMRELAGYELTPADEQEFAGATSLWLSARLAERHGLNLDPRQVAARKFERLYEVFRAELFPGAAEFVRACHGRWPLGLASNSPEHFVRRTLAECALTTCFHTVVTVDDVRRRKPDPDMLLLCAERLGSPPTAVLVFEDTLIGVEAALRAGCQVVLMDNGMLPETADTPPGVPVATWERLLAVASAGGSHSA